MDVVDEGEKGGVRGDLRVFGLSSQSYGRSIIWDGEVGGRLISIENILRFLALLRI